jgi:polysaccharide deacetylase family protein (PEP-CTERM system associated)
MFIIPPLTNTDSPILLLSVDFEDWHQLARRRVGWRDWERPGPALARQTDALLALLDELNVRATFFVLGMAARAHGYLLEQVVAHGHEIGCHGDQHRPVFTQSRDEFADDLATARETIERLTGRTPVGYRAPAFSITRDTPWAYEVLADEGFGYDASQHDSPRIRRREQVASTGPHPIELPGDRVLWEFPVAVWRTRRSPVPVGGPSYWAVLPTRLVLQGLEQAGPLAGLYMHPHEFDPRPLRLGLPASSPVSQRARGAMRAAQRNSARLAAPRTLRAIARRFRLIPYGEAYAELSASTPART